MKAHGLAVVDVPSTVSEEIAWALATASQQRNLGDVWRHSAAAILIAAFPMCYVHVGGHHIALHAPGPMHFGAIETGPCMGRIVETREGTPV